MTGEDAAALTRLILVSKRIDTPEKWATHLEFLMTLEQSELVDYCVFLLGALDAGLAQDAVALGLPPDQATALLAMLGDFEAKQ